MLEFKNKTLQYDFSRCQQCGACVAVCPTRALSVEHAEGRPLPVVRIDRDKCIRCGRCVRVCPPAISRHDSFGREYFDRMNASEFYLCANSSADVAFRASSGGAARTIIVESLRSGRVDAVFALGKDGNDSPAGTFYTSDDMPDYDSIPNSVYCSVMQCLRLCHIRRCDRLMVVGTACQLRAIDAYLRMTKFDGSIVKVCIFCKQQKTSDATRFMAKMAGTGYAPGHNECIRYRGNGWPGSVEINGASLDYRRAATLPFGHRLWSVPGCNVCGDPFGLHAGADLALMDPWGMDLGDRSNSTLTLAMSKAGEDLLNATPRLVSTPLDTRPPLGFRDIRRKQTLVAFYRGEKVGRRIRLAGRLDRMERSTAGSLLLALPRLPMIAYRVLGRLPQLRNIILK